MKKIILTLSLVIATLNLAAQNHLSFKGIPIKGSITEFCKQLESKGFSYLDKDNDWVFFSGTFTGKNATIAVKATGDRENVFSVTVAFESVEEWNALANTYDYYKELYTRKYGNPTYSNEYIPPHAKLNNMIIMSLHQALVEYVSTWEIAGGEIILSVEKGSGYKDGRVVILYSDSQNIKDKMENDLEEI